MFDLQLLALGVMRLIQFPADNPCTFLFDIDIALSFSLEQVPIKLLILDFFPDREQHPELGSRAQKLRGGLIDFYSIEAWRS